MAVRGEVRERESRKPGSQMGAIPASSPASAREMVADFRGMEWSQ